MRKFRQGDAPVILYSKSGVRLYEFVDRYLYTDDDDLANLLLAMGAVEVPPYVPPVPQDLTEVIERLDALGGRVSSVEARSNIRRIGDGLSLSGEGELSATGSGGEIDLEPLTDAELEEIFA